VAEQGAVRLSEVWFA